MTLLSGNTEFMPWKFQMVLFKTAFEGQQHGKPAVNKHLCGVFSFWRLRFLPCESMPSCQERPSLKGQSQGNLKMAKQTFKLAQKGNMSLVQDLDGQVSGQERTPTVHE